MEYLQANGISKEQIENVFTQILEDKKPAKEVINYLENNRKILSSEEYFKTKMEFPRMPEGVLGLMVPNTKYFINVKLTTIAIILLLLDIKLTSGFATTIGGMLGKTGQSVIKLTFENKCLVLDMISRELFNIDDLNKNGMECTRNDLECSFRKNGICNRDSNALENQMNDLVGKNVIIKKGTNYLLAL